jgi:hypothetical protein
MTIPSDAITGIQVTIENSPSPGEIEEAAAIELVKRDAESAQAWIEGQQWNEAWRQIDILYDSPRQFGTWEGSSVQKVAVNRFILCQHVNSIHPQFTDGLFYDDQYFVATPKPGTDNDIVRARAAVIRAQLKEMCFEDEVGLGTFQTILHGTGIYKWGLRKIEEKFYEYKRKGEPLSQTGPMGEKIEVQTEESSTFEEVPRTRVVLKPFFENREIRNLLVNPKCKVPNIRKAGWLVDKFYLTLADLMELAKDKNYDLPDEETLKKWIAEQPKELPSQMGNLDTTPGSPAIAGQGSPDWMDTSDDPYQDALMCLERWDDHKVITTINNKKVIQNRENPYGCLPYYSSNFYNRIRSFWGIGLGKIVGTDQRLQQGLENGGLGLLQLLLDPPFAINEEAYVPTQNVRFRKGGFVKVKGDVRAAIAPLEMPRAPIGELMAFLQNSASHAEAAGGASEMFSQGAMPGPGTAGRSSATRNATGAAGVISAQAGRLQGPVGRFCRQVFLPWIYQLDELNRRFIMTTPEGMQQIKDILGDELGKDFKFPEDKFLSGGVVFDVLAGSHIAAKKTMAQAMPLITQIFENPALQDQLADLGYYVDVRELLMMWQESTGWRNTRSLIKKMSKEQLAAHKEKTSQASKTAQQSQILAQKGKQASDLQTQKTHEGIARDVVKEATKSAGSKDEIANSLEQGEAGDLRRNFLSEGKDAINSLGEGE